MRREFTGRGMAIIMVAFFSVVIAVNLFMAIIAQSSWTGLVVPNSYVASQNFDKATAALERSAAMDVHALLEYGDGEVRLALRDSSGNPIRANIATLKIGRPSNEREDRSLTMTCSADGICRARANFASGIWSGDVKAELSSGARWQRAVRLFVKREQAT